jgi:hypothetical protein
MPPETTAFASVQTSLTAQSRPRLFLNNKIPANRDGGRVLCCDVGGQETLAVLVIASDWSESRGVFLWQGVV